MIAAEAAEVSQPSVSSGHWFLNMSKQIFIKLPCIG
jgi:hypothetical protein